MQELLAYRCPACNLFLDGAEIKSIKAGSTEMKACARCGGALVTERSRVVQPVAASLARATLYPLRPLTLAISVGVMIASFLASYVPFGDLVAWGIRFGWLFAVLRAASSGADDPEIDPSEIGPTLVSWTGPFVRYALAAIVACGPALAAALLLGDSGYAIAGLLAVVGSLYLPAALIIAAHDESLVAGLNPLPALRLIARIPGPYATACALLAVLGLLAGGTVLAARALAIPIASPLIEAVVGFLPLVGAARMLGVLVHECREEL